MKYFLGRSNFRKIEEGYEKEWIIGNGIGGYSSSTIIGVNARTHHNYLNVSLNPPVNRLSILSKTCEMVEINNEVFDLSSQTYVNYNKNGQEYLTRFELDESVPTYHYNVKDIFIKKTVCIQKDKNTVVVCYEILNGRNNVKFTSVPMFTHKRLGEVLEKNQLMFEFVLSKEENMLKLRYDDNLDLEIKFYSSDGEFYDRKNIRTSMATPNFLIEENVFYPIDNRNGFLGLDNYYTPYEVQLYLSPFETKKFYLKCTVEEFDFKDGFEIVDEYKERMKSLGNSENKIVNTLSQAADHFIVKRESTSLKTILAGFPWFLDWGRDTMIAFTGLTLSTGRFSDAEEILESFSKYEKDGLIPNMFPNSQLEKPCYNTVDASLWYFYAVHKYLEYTSNFEFIRIKIYPTLKKIIEAYKKGTKFSIKMDDDGLIHAGNHLDQLTWMDVRVGDLVVTPRHGKPVEINALWYNALKVMEKLSHKFGESFKEYLELSELVKESFNKKFWDNDKKCLKDVVDEDDSSVRPNQIWAVSLPYTMMSKEREKLVVEKVFEELYTPYGIRSLSNYDERYRGMYIGKLFERDLSYHMGTSWGFISGAFMSAYCKVYEYNTDAVLKIKYMCDIFLDSLYDGCINGIAEIFDGDFSCTSRGCFTQAWSVGEVLRVYTEDILRHLREENIYE